MSRNPDSSSRPGLRVVVVEGGPRRSRPSRESILFFSANVSWGPSTPSRSFAELPLYEQLLCLGGYRGSEDAPPSAIYPSDPPHSPGSTGGYFAFFFPDLHVEYPAPPLLLTSLDVLFSPIHVPSSRASTLVP